MVLLFELAGRHRRRNRLSANLPGHFRKGASGASVAEPRFSPLSTNDNAGVALHRTFHAR
jgi:hypothetical protein